jgi:outer membrane protein OmpA-like peptidoglycan-associated protein
MNLRRPLLLFVLGITLSLCGCAGFSFFSSESTLHNPVPKPERILEDSDHGSKKAKASQKEPPRTPSLVWLPENRRHVQAAATHNTGITDTNGDMVSTGFGDCLTSGYALLDGMDCSVNPQVANELAPPSESENTSLAGLEVDLLGIRPKPIAGDDGAQMAGPIPTAVAEVMGDTEPSVSDEDQRTPFSQYQRRTIAHNPSSGLIPARYERFVLSSDVLFEFAKVGLDGLSGTGQHALRALLDRFAKYDSTSLRKVIITGHSDRLGSPSANVNVSEKRAMAVKAFLIGAGIDADIIMTAGVGSVAPLKHCLDKTKSTQLKSCLAPNRRVEIEIMGAA